MPYQVGDKVQLDFQEGTGNARPIQAVVLAEESPGMFRLHTDMGINILVPTTIASTIAPGGPPHD